MKKALYTFIILISGLTFTGCTDFFNPETSDVLDEKNYIKDNTEAITGYLGVAASVQQVADQALFLEGLRGDFLEPTVNASREMWNIYNYQDLTGNSFASPKGYYNVIINANDYLEHLFAYRMKDSTSIRESTFNGLVSGTLRYKAWAYLQLAKIYGEAIYFDDPITALGEMNKYPMLSFDDVISKCINLIESGYKGIDGKSTVIWTQELGRYYYNGVELADSYINMSCPPSEMLLAELYLYKNEFQKVRDNCLALLNANCPNGKLRMDLSYYNAEWKDLFSKYTGTEDLSLQVYDKNYGQVNRLYEYYSNGLDGKYYFRPTPTSIKRFKGQFQDGGTVKGDTYRGENSTYKVVNNDTVVYKFMQTNPSSVPVYLKLYRASDLYMFLVESLVGLGRFQEAVTFLNKGLAGVSLTITNNKFNAPYEDYPVSMQGSKNGNTNTGVRGLVNLNVVGSFALSSATALDTLINMRRLDSLIVEESCMEFGGEGKALYAMNRNVRRWSSGANNSWAAKWINTSNSSAATLLWGNKVQNDWADKIGAKYKNGMGSEVSSKLKSDLNNWFMKYRLE